MPKVLEWMELNPSVEIRVEASHQKVDFNQSASDISICFDDQDCIGLEKTRLFTDSVSLVASPQLLKMLDDSSDLQAIL